MSDTERRVWLETYCDDLGAYTAAEIGNACKRYRTSGENRYFPTPGALLDLMKNPYADPPTAHKGDDLWKRLGFGGGGCKCERCGAKARRDGFFAASQDDYRRDETTRKELAYFAESKTLTSRLDDDEQHKRFLMTQELVRDHGWEWEVARRKVMVERTREIYPEFRVWPVLGEETL